MINIQSEYNSFLRIVGHKSILAGCTLCSRKSPVIDIENIAGIIASPFSTDVFSWVVIYEKKSDNSLGTCEEKFLRK